MHRSYRSGTFRLVNHGVPKPPLVNFVKLMIIGFDIVVN